jgi:hypothetical protein
VSQLCRILSQVDYRMNTLMRPEFEAARALDDLLNAGQKVTRTLLGVGVDPADPCAWSPSTGAR